jgi:hypothetical protein
MFVYLLQNKVILISTISHPPKKADFGHPQWRISATSEPWRCSPGPLHPDTTLLSLPYFDRIRYGSLWHQLCCRLWNGMTHHELIINNFQPDLGKSGRCPN